MADGNFGGGSGTKENPWLIDDLWDYLKIDSKVTEDSVYFKLTKDIDMNNYEDYKFEIPNLCIISNSRHCYLDGDNHSIKNIIIKDSTKSIFANQSTKYGELKNIKFENLILINVSNANVLFKCKSFKNVHIGCFIFDSDIGPLFPACPQSNDCSFNIKGKLKDNSSFRIYIDSDKRQLERVHINLDLFVNSGTTSFVMGYSNGTNTIDNVYFTGKMKYNQVTSTSFQIVRDITFKNSYVNVDLFLPSRVTSISPYNLSCPTFCFANQEKIKHLDGDISGISFSPTTNFSFLTDSECRDPVGLLEKGFPVVPSDS